MLRSLSGRQSSMRCDRCGADNYYGTHAVGCPEKIKQLSTEKVGDFWGMVGVIIIILGIIAVFVIAALGLP